jgi:hypothetical protein
MYLRFVAFHCVLLRKLSEKFNLLFTFVFTYLASVLVNNMCFSPYVVGFCSALGQ